MYKSHFLRGDETMKQECKSFANKLTKIKTAAKKEYYAKELKLNESIPRKTWEILRILKRSNSATLSTSIDINGIKVTDLLEKFNSYFSTVWQNVANTVHLILYNESLKHYLKDRVYS